MKYINKGKRDILIFPQFDKIDEIEKIRKQYDELYGIVPPHITLAFPFENSLSNEELKQELISLLKNEEPFYIETGDITLNKDTRVNTNYIFLNIKSGQDKIINIHNKIYDKILKAKLDFKYIPHITLGCINSDNIPINLQIKFSTIVSKVSVEFIGDNEESNIIFEIELNKKEVI